MMPLRLIVLAIISMLIFGCTRKKKASPSLGNWLEQHFPNRFQIVDTHMADPIRNLSFKVYKSVVAEKTDSLLQIELTWDKRMPDLGLSAGEIDNLFEKEKPALNNARDLFAALKSAGFEKVSASIRHGNATVLVFENPSPENRKRVLNSLKSAFSNWPAAPKYGLWVGFMEPSMYAVEFGDIVPLAHWVRPDSWQRRNMVVFSKAPKGYDFNVRQLEKDWEFNTESNLLEQWVERARPMAERWAAAHFKKQVFLASQTEYELLTGKLGVQLKFAVSFQENGDAVGYVVGDFLLGSDVFQNLRISAE